MFIDFFVPKRFVSNMSSIPLPSHYYMSLVKCHNSAISLLSCSADELDILSFILPHQPKTHNCIVSTLFNIRAHVYVC